jgi:aminopeptidase N
MMRRLLQSALAVAMIGASLPAQQKHYERQAGVDVQHYSFAVALNDSTDEIAGETNVTIRFTRDGLGAFFLDLATASNGKGMTVTAVESDNSALRYSHAGDRLNIMLGRPTTAGELRKFTIRYHGVASGGLTIGKNRYQERFFSSRNWPDKAHLWLPTIDHPSDKATAEFIVTAPEKYLVVSNGLLQEEVLLGDGRKMTRWKQSVPTAVWLYNIAVEQFAVHHAGMVKGVELQSWVAHQDAGKFAAFDEPGRQALEFFSENVGPYSYEKLANVAIGGGGGGMEHASAIFYGENTVDRQSSGVVSHEIAHQWFGDAVTEDEWDDVWLSEGFATYFANLFTEHFGGREAFVDALKRGRIGAFRAERQQKTAVVHQNAKGTGPDLTQVQYAKGGWILHVLRGQVGTENFWKGIQLYYKRFRDSNATTDDLRRAMEEASGQELGWFFSQWLTRVDAPVIDGGWSYDASAKKIIVELAQTQPGEPYRMPMEIGITTDRVGAVMQVEKIEMTRMSQRFEIPADRAPRDVALDPNVWMLMEAKFVKR